MCRHHDVGRRVLRWGRLAVLADDAWAIQGTSDGGIAGIDQMVLLCSWTEQLEGPWRQGSVPAQRRCHDTRGA
jgi:hypothetical protein